MMEVQVMPSYFRLLIMAAAVATLIYFATKLSGRTLVVLLGTGLVMFLLLFVSYTQVAPRQAPITSDSSASLSTTVEAPLKDRSVATRAFLIPLDNPSKQVKQDQDKSTTVRPEWVDVKPQRIGDVYRRVISSGPHRTVDECHQELSKKLLFATLERLNDLSDVSYNSNLRNIGVGLEYIWREICPREYIETSMHDFGGVDTEMKTVHVLMEFTPAIDRHLARASKKYLRQRRMEDLVQVSMVILASLAGVYGLLKFDTWTRGYYTKRLVIGTMLVGLLFFVVALS